MRRRVRKSDGWMIAYVAYTPKLPCQVYPSNLAIFLMSTVVSQLILSIGGSHF